MARRRRPQVGLIRRPPVPLDRADHHAAGAAERVQTALSIVSPLAVGTVLLFYFGWVRTKYERRRWATTRRSSNSPRPTMCSAA